MNAFLPKLYFVGQKSTIFTNVNYALFVLQAVFHAVLVFVVPYYTYLDSIAMSNGQTADLWMFSVTSFTAIILTVDLKLCGFTRHFSYWNFLALVPLSVLIYYAFIWVLQLFPQDPTYETMVEIHMSPLYYLAILLMVAIAYFSDQFVVTMLFNVFPSPTDFLRGLVRQGEDPARHRSAFEKLYAKIQQYYLEEGFKREAFLERRREYLARMVAQAEARHAITAKVKPEEK